MTTANEQTISHMLQTQQSISLDAVLPVYMHFAGLPAKVVGDYYTALRSIERAINKHPAPPLTSTRRRKVATTTTVSGNTLLRRKLYFSEIEQLRKEYNEKKAAMCKELGVGICACHHCGRTVEVPPMEESLSLGRRLEYLLRISLGGKAGQRCSRRPKLRGTRQWRL